MGVLNSGIGTEEYQGGGADIVRGGRDASSSLKSNECRDAWRLSVSLEKAVMTMVWGADDGVVASLQLPSFPKMSTVAELNLAGSGRRLKE